MDYIITGCVNPLFMGYTVRLDLPRILEVTGELQHFLELGTARLEAEGPLSEEESEALIFSLADQLEDHLRTMRERQGSASIRDLQRWTRAWIEEQQEDPGKRAQDNRRWPMRMIPHLRRSRFTSIQRFFFPQRSHRCSHSMTFEEYSS